MYLLRRAAVRSVSSLSSPVQARTLITKAPTGLRQTQRWQLPIFQQRFASDEASPAQAKTSDETVTTEPTEAEQAMKEESNAERSTVQQTIDSAKETVESAKETVSDLSSRAAEAVTGESAYGTYANPKPSKILYVGNLFFEVKAQDLEAEFAKFGTVTNARIAQDNRGLSRGFGFIEFESAADAIEAQKALDQQPLSGRNMAVQFHVRREPNLRNRPIKMQSNAPSKTLFIGNMSFQMSDKDLNDLFRSITNVLDVRVAVDRRSGQPRGFCHADFIDIPSAEKAKEALNGKQIYGRELRVDFTRNNNSNRNQD